VLEDEVDLGTEVHTMELSFEVVAITYRELISSFEKNLHYKLAEECFCGAMEMRRRDPDNFWFARRPFFKSLYARNRFARWVVENLSILGLYRTLSNYGSSYKMAFCWLLGLILFFAVLYPFAGLQAAVTTPASIGRSENLPFFWQGSRHLTDLMRTMGAGLWTSLEVVTLQKRPVFELSMNWGRRMEIFEQILVSGQLALFVLALRRRFKR
jgi:hypothetical protein